jgi:D-alanyl-D-alanine dipeptidase
MMLLCFSSDGACAEDDFVDLGTIAPSIRLELRYATANNFTHQVVYPTARCLLRREVAERLGRVQAELEKHRLGLKIWDCYRPLSVQRRFFALVPDERYVADPKKGSRHNRGAAVDLTLVDERGVELEMGSGFDDFSKRAHRGIASLPATVREHRAQLDAAMAKEGFTGLPTEWWHFDAPRWKAYPIADVPLDSTKP